MYVQLLDAFYRDMASALYPNYNVTSWTPLSAGIFDNAGCSSELQIVLLFGICGCQHEAQHIISYIILYPYHVGLPMIRTSTSTP